MSETATRIPVQVTRGCLVASIQVDLDEAVLRAFRADLLARIRDTRVHGVILDVSGVVVMDVVDFESLRRTMEMTALMGAEPIIVGLRAGLVSALVDLDAEVDSVRAAFDLDHAFDLLSRRGAATRSGADGGHAHSRQR